ncbi:hypothetical protein [Nonomuraea rosea]
MIRETGAAGGALLAGALLTIEGGARDVVPESSAMTGIGQFLVMRI